MTRNPMPPDAVGVRLNLSPADRDRLLLAAARAGKSMSSYLREVVLAHLDEVEAGETKRRPKRER